MINKRQSKEERIENLGLEDIIGRTIVNCASDIDPLIKYLGMDLPSKTIAVDRAKEIALYFREMGSNNIATLLRGGEPVKYGDVVYDVGKNIKAGVGKVSSAFENEKKIIEKIFADTLDKMSAEEKKELFKNMGISSEDIPVGEIGTIITQILLGKFGGFGIYKISLIVANAIARQILGRGLSLATNAMIARGISVFTGPIGWVITGIWLLVDMAGPAYRKTVPAVIYTAALRLMLIYRINIGVVGDGSTGKDSLLKAVFGINTGNVNPVAGSTSSMEIYDLGVGSYLTNFPGFNDYRKEVNKELDDYIRHMDVFILLVDITRGVTKTDIEIFKNIKSFEKPILVCLNKIDLPRTQEERNSLLIAAKQRIHAENFIETAFDPDKRLHEGGPIGCKKVYKWTCDQIEVDGKDSSNIPKGF